MLLCPHGGGGQQTFGYIDTEDAPCPSCLEGPQCHPHSSEASRAFAGEQACDLCGAFSPPRSSAVVRQTLKENASVFLGDPRTRGPRSNPGLFCGSLLVSCRARALLWSLRVGHKAIDRERNVLQGCLIIKGSASKLKPDCPQTLANRNLMSPRDRDQCPGDWGGRPHLEAWVHCGKTARCTRTKAQETCHLRRSPRAAEMFKPEKAHRSVGSPPTPEGPLGERRSFRGTSEEQVSVNRKTFLVSPHPRECFLSSWRGEVLLSGVGLKKPCRQSRGPASCSEALVNNSL